LITIRPNNQPAGNAFAIIRVSIQKCGSSKELTFLPGEEIAGHYLAQISPSKSGAYSLVFNGQVEVGTVQITVPIEDIEDAGRLNFHCQAEIVDNYVETVVEEEL
jgi:hypothetical protein